MVDYIMDEIKVFEVLIKYFGETGSLIILILILFYGTLKYYLIKRQTSIINKIESYLKVLSQKYSDSITYEQSEIILKEVYYSSACYLINHMNIILDQNNIERDWKVVIAKCKDIIDINYAEDFSKLTKFVVDSICVVEVMENLRRNYIYDGIVSILGKQKGNSAKKQLESFIKNSFTKFYNDDIMKIDKRKKQND